MVTKGLDFDHVSLVGVFDADRMMHFPDFRSYERAFHLITQVSGRAGRRAKQGKVVIQTSNPSHKLFSFIIKNDVIGFLQEQVRDRQENLYPPFTRLIEITFKHIDKKIAREVSEKYADEIRPKLKQVRLLGPGEPMISKIRNEYLMTLLLKIPRGIGHLAEMKTMLLETSHRYQQTKEYRNVKFVFDVDPV
jgi:primosomal protein N' (replication factor Y)